MISMKVFKEFRQAYSKWGHLSIPDRTHECVIADWVEFLEEKITASNKDYAAAMPKRCPNCGVEWVPTHDEDSIFNSSSICSCCGHRFA